ncbi:BURP domain-containing protein 3-like [Prosopis cineraria]|uniref:BURP domain-containing protein 3-like n=1 Tax=Prosopis cineraria TaxID=364024 RepID=UPI00240EF2CB|nr:BURP domain-containing protein 3-like [Prosopis cineraria]
MTKFSLLPIIAFLTVALEATHEALLPPELYWKSMLPTTPMPKSITDLLHPSGGGTIVHSGINVKLRSQPRFATYMKNYGRSYGTRHTTIQDDKSNANFFFLEKDLKPGHKMNMPFFFQTSNQDSTFLPREVVKSIPFSSSKMAVILKKFAVKVGSAYAEVLKNTIEECERSEMKGEEKYCATSLESMVDFSIFKLGKSVKALSLEVMNAVTMEEEEYTISQGVKKVAEAKVVVYHKLDYVYAVFYCHNIKNTDEYMVPLEGALGSRMKAVSVCHKDTSQWNPKHIAFQMLKVKPGSVPLCHFLLPVAVVWVP